MGNLRQFKKGIKPTLTFAPDMYSNTFGSYIICSYILNGGDINHIRKTWKQVVKSPTDYIDLADPEWLEKWAELFKVEYDLTGRIAFCEGQLNNVFCLVDEDGNLYATREDGWLPKSVLDAVKAKKVKILIEME